MIFSTLRNLIQNVKIQEYRLRSVDCDRQRRVICQQSPLSYLDVSTELLLITDGRSNDPREYGISIEEMKHLYTSTEINVSQHLLYHHQFM